MTMTAPFSMKRCIQFAETDIAGVLHFSNYFRLMEEVEHAFWRSLGMSVIFRDGERDISWPRVATSCEYFAPVRFEDEVELLFRLENIGDRSLTFEVEFRRDGECVAKGKTTAVCCSMAKGRFETITIPDPIREKLSRSIAD